MTCTACEEEHADGIALTACADCGQELEEPAFFCMHCFDAELSYLCSHCWSAFVN